MLVVAPSRITLYILSLVAGASVFFLIASVSHAPPTPHNSWKAISSIVTDANADSAGATTRIGRLTASFDDGDNELAARMLTLQTQHAEKWNYPMHTLHRELLSSQWTKPAWIMSIMVAECAKPPEERLEWLLYAVAHELLLTRNTADLLCFGPSVGPTPTLLCQIPRCLSTSSCLLRHQPSPMSN